MRRPGAAWSPLNKRAGPGRAESVGEGHVHAPQQLRPLLFQPTRRRRQRRASAAAVAAAAAATAAAARVVPGGGGGGAGGGGLLRADLAELRLRRGERTG